jgi:transcriptional regulator with XRE-family HTH domain
MLMNIGGTIKLIRQVAGLTQDELATRLDITSNYVSLLENNHATPKLALLTRIESEFDVPAAFILWNSKFESKKNDRDLSERYRKLGEQMTELAITLIRRRRGAEGA